MSFSQSLEMLNSNQFVLSDLQQKMKSHLIFKIKMKYSNYLGKITNSHFRNFSNSTLMVQHMHDITLDSLVLVSAMSNKSYSLHQVRKETFVDNSLILQIFDRTERSLDKFCRDLELNMTSLKSTIEDHSSQTFSKKLKKLVTVQLKNKRIGLPFTLGEINQALLDFLFTTLENTHFTSLSSESNTI